MVLWNMAAESRQPEMTMLPLPSDVFGERKAYLLPVLSQNVSTTVEFLIGFP